jgi:hypothetical protein
MRESLSQNSGRIFHRQGAKSAKERLGIGDWKHLAISFEGGDFSVESGCDALHAAHCLMIDRVSKIASSLKQLGEIQVTEWDFMALMNTEIHELEIAQSLRRLGQIQVTEWDFKNVIPAVKKTANQEVDVVDFLKRTANYKVMEWDFRTPTSPKVESPRGEPKTSDTTALPAICDRESHRRAGLSPDSNLTTWTDGLKIQAAADQKRHCQTHRQRRPHCGRNPRRPASDSSDSWNAGTVANPFARRGERPTCEVESQRLIHIKFQTVLFKDSQLDPESWLTIEVSPPVWLKRS